MGTRAGNFWILGALAVSAILLIVAAAGAGAQPAILEWTVPSGGSQPTNIAADASGNLWFTERDANKIARINQNGAFQEFNVPTDHSQPWGIVVDSNGRVWFTEVDGNKIGNMSPGGLFGQDNIPTRDSQPRGLAVDGSGNVWFAESRGNRIGRFSPSSSQFAEWSVPTSNSQPWAVALDSSGNVWFTERNGNKIGRLTPGGLFSEFSIPTSGSAPTGIAVDGSGNVWFAEYDGNKIGVLTPSGTITEYNIPTGSTRPTWLATDTVGSIWYAGSNSNTFGRVLNGSLTEYGIPTSNTSPTGIATDGYGNVWFTEQTANKIGKAVGLVPVATPTPVSPSVTPLPAPAAGPRDSRYFDQTGFRIDNDVFWDYFNKRGGVHTFGYPVSRTFTLQGFTVQFFQRSILQIGPDGTARTLNLLDSGLMPYTRINGSTFPGPEQSLADAAPSPGSADYDARIQEFIMKYCPNQYDGMNVNYLQAFQNTVTLQDAFPLGNGNAALLPLLNLELWGLPTSRPQRDPNNGNFVYLRFQRGILHYDATTGATQGLLLADYLKSIMTGQNLPPDLDAQAAGSIFYKQYNPYKPNWVDRPDQLPGTDLSYAFEKDGAPMPTPMPATATPVAPAPTATAVPAASTAPENIEVVGAQDFTTQVNDALQILAAKSPYNYGIVKQNVYRIEWADSSSSSTDLAAHTLKINSATAFPPAWNNYRDQQQEWLAGLIVHNAVHIAQYSRGAATTGADAEQEALLRQQDALAGIETTSPAGQFWKYVQNALDNNTGWFGDWPEPRDPQ